MQRQTITLIDSNISANCLARTYLVAKILCPFFNVIIRGFALYGHIWGPLERNDIKIKPMKLNRQMSLYNNITRLSKIIANGSHYIYAFKVLPTSFGVALLSKLQRGNKILLDIDDWETAGLRNLTLNGLIKKTLLTHISHDGVLAKVILEKGIPCSVLRTSPSPMLSKRFNGYFLASGCDGTLFNHRNFNRSQIRDELGIGHNKKIIMFAGTLRPHKGIEELIKACQLIRRKDFYLFFLGIDSNLTYWKKLKEIGFNQMIEYPLLPKKEVARFLSIADLVVLPQRNQGTALGQVPIKLFEAMAMAKPLIVTENEDFKHILGDLAIYINPDDIIGLSASIENVLYNRKDAVEIGLKLREHFENHYSFEKLTKRLYTILKDESII